jgi:hypothetical protein
MKKNGLTIADDFKETWAKAEEKRADFYQGRTGAVSREDVGRAIHQLENAKIRRNR